MVEDVIVNLVVSLKNNNNSMFSMMAQAISKFCKSGKYDSRISFSLIKKPSLLYKAYIYDICNGSPLNCGVSLCGG